MYAFSVKRGQGEVALNGWPTAKLDPVPEYCTVFRPSTPIAFVAYYISRRKWGSAVLASAVAALLWLPAIPLGIADYPTAPLPTIALWGANVVAGAALAAAAVAATAWLALTRSSWTTFAAGVTTLAASPVLFITNMPQLLVAVWETGRGGPRIDAGQTDG